MNRLVASSDDELDLDLDREIEYAFDADDAIGLPRGPIGGDVE